MDTEMPELLLDLQQLAERLVQLTSDQPTINDLKRMEEENE